MKLHQILSGASFIFGFIGISGIEGAIYNGTGFLTASALCGIAAALGIWAGYESGYWKKNRGK